MTDLILLLVRFMNSVFDTKGVFSVRHISIPSWKLSSISFTDKPKKLEKHIQTRPWIYISIHMRKSTVLF